MKPQEKNRILERAYQESFPGIRANEEKKKIKILKASIEFIAKQGVSQMNIGTLARALGMSRSNLGYYFKDTEELLEGVVRLVTATAQQITIQSIAEAGKEPEAVLEAVIAGAFLWAREYPHQMNCMLMFFFYASFDKKLLETSNRIRDVGLKRICILLSVSSGFPEDDRRVRETAMRIQSTITGFLLTSIIHTHAGKNSDLERSCKDSVDALLTNAFKSRTSRDAGKDQTSE